MSTLDRLRGGLPGRFYAVSFAGFLWEMGLFMTQPILTLHYLNIGASILFIGLILSLQAFLLLFLRLPLTIVAREGGGEEDARPELRGAGAPARPHRPR